MKVHKHTHTHTHTYGEKEKERERQVDRETHRPRDSHTNVRQAIPFKCAEKAEIVGIKSCSHTQDI